MNRRQTIIAAVCMAAAIVATGCEHGHLGAKSKTIDVPAKLTITRDGSGVFDFKYDAPFADADGNFDFSKGEPYGRFVKLSFTISDDSGLGLKFKPAGADAIWIVEKKNVGPDGSPEGPYRGDQFRDFNVSADGKTLSLTDVNDDGVLYQYGLRFDLGGQTVVDDPEVNNGSGGGHTGGT